MKKLISLLMALLMLTGGAALAEESLLEQHAAALAQDMTALVACEAYTQAFTGYADGAVRQCVAAYGDCAWCRPVLTAYLAYDAAALDALIAENGVGEKELALVMIPALAAALNQPQTSEELIAMNILRTTVTYADPAQPDGAMAFLRVYEDGAPLLFAVTARDGAVAMSCSVILTDADALSACRTLDEVGAWLQRTPLPVLLAHDAPVMMLSSELAIPAGTVHHMAVNLAAAARVQWAAPSWAQVMGLDEGQKTMLAAWLDMPEELRMVVHVPLDVRTHGSALWGNDGVVALATGGDAVVRRITRQLPGSAVTQLGARLTRVDEHVLMSICSAQTIALAPDAPDGAGVYLLFMGDADVMAVSYVNENGVASLSAQFLPLPELAACGSAAEVALWLAGHWMPLNVTEIQLN